VVWPPYVDELMGRGKWKWSRRTARVGRGASGSGINGVVRSRASHGGEGDISFLVAKRSAMEDGGGRFKVWHFLIGWARNGGGGMGENIMPSRRVTWLMEVRVFVYWNKVYLFMVEFMVDIGYIPCPSQ
jgi:hypothetical protein